MAGWGAEGGPRGPQTRLRSLLPLRSNPCRHLPVPGELQGGRLPTASPSEHPVRCHIKLTCNLGAVSPAALPSTMSSLRNPENEKSDSRGPATNTEASRAGGKNVSVNAHRPGHRDPSEKGQPVCSPGVEVLNVDVSVRSGLPLAPQQQAFLGRGFWNDSQEKCPQGHAYHFLHTASATLPGPTPPTPSLLQLLPEDGSWSPAPSGRLLVALRDSKRTLQARLQVMT